MHRFRLLSRAALVAILGGTLAAGGMAALAEPPRGGYAPDPPGTPSRKQWVFDVLHRKGKTSILAARPTTLERPAATVRLMGRFAVELYVGPELLDRVRFNVPLTGDAPEKDPSRPFRRPTFDEGVTARLKVMMADQPRASWMKLVDRLSGAEERFWWPPDEQGRLTPMGAGAATDAGTRTDAGTDAGTRTDADAGTGAGGDAGARSGARR
jgi:hypothetical protein